MSQMADHSAQSDISKMNSHDKDGGFKRAASVFRSTIEKGGQFEAEKDRYHLYVSYACPWATRALIVRKMKGLEKLIPVTITSPHMGAQGWPFANVDSFKDAEEDPLYGSEHIKDLYFRANTDYEGRFTVPVLWDKKTHTIVNNESSEIIRIFNTSFNELISKDHAAVDIYPEAHRAEIDEVNQWVYDTVNNGVYKSGFAKSQEAYDAAVHALFKSLDRLEKMLHNKEYLIGNVLTEADIRLWVTIIRFDPVYHGHFKCNIRDIRHGYPNIHTWMRKLYWKNDAFKKSTNFDHIKTHYYWSQTNVNPTRIIAAGPDPNILPL